MSSLVKISHFCSRAIAFFIKIFPVLSNVLAPHCDSESKFQMLYNWFGSDWAKNLGQVRKSRFWTFNFAEKKQTLQSESNFFGF